jgi:6-phosphofructokinase
MSFVAVAVAAVAVGATSYAAVSASNNAHDAIAAQNLNTAAGRALAEKLQNDAIAASHDDLNRQLIEQVNEFKTKAVLAAQSEQNQKTFDTEIAVIAALGVGTWLYMRK